MVTKSKSRKRVTTCPNCGEEMIEDGTESRSVFYCTNTNKKINCCNLALPTYMVKADAIHEETFLK